MKLIIMTDMEGCAGVLNFTDWVYPQGRYYEQGKAILTREVNAAIRGFRENGAGEILVLDGHGFGGLDLMRLDESVFYQRGFPGPYPIGISGEYDAIAWVGQHAKSGTPFAHMAHTSSLDVLDLRVNGRSVGEFGMSAYISAALGVKPLLACGDLALCREASELCPHIYTAWVKKGMDPGSGDECTPQEYEARNLSAIHLHPAAAERKIYEAACLAARAFAADPGAFSVPPLHGPYTVEIDYRANCPGVSTGKRYRHEEDLIAALNLSWEDCAAP